VNNTTPGSPFILLAFLVLSVIAIAGGKPGKWKLYNFLIILASCAFGVSLGALPIMWGMNAAISGNLAASFLLIFGAAGVYVCMRRNTKRNTKPASD
jgi:heme A synthase